MWNCVIVIRKILKMLASVSMWKGSFCQFWTEKSGIYAAVLRSRSSGRSHTRLPTHTFHLSEVVKRTHRSLSPPCSDRQGNERDALRQEVHHHYGSAGLSFRWKPVVAHCCNLHKVHKKCWRWSKVELKLCSQAKKNVKAGTKEEMRRLERMQKQLRLKT